MGESKEDLIKFLKSYDSKESLKNLTKEEVKVWIKEEWEELLNDGASHKETTGIILDSNHKWMSLSIENKLFVYEELINLNKALNLTEIVEALEKTINIIRNENLK